MTLAQSIAKRMLSGRQPVATAKAAPKPPSAPVRVSIAAHKGTQTAAPSLKSSGKTGSAAAEPRAKSAKQADYSKSVIIDVPARVVSAPARHTRPAAYNPPRRPEPDIRALVESFAPPPVTPPPPPAVIAPGFRGSCKAVDAATGRTCKLPHHPEHPDQHRSERGPFHRLAAPGQTNFLRTSILDAAATRRSPDAWDTSASPGPTAQAGKPKPRRDKAHAGTPTTEDHPAREALRQLAMGGLNFSGLTQRADGCFVHRSGVILPNGELADDFNDDAPTRSTTEEAA